MCLIIREPERVRETEHSHYYAPTLRCICHQCPHVHRSLPSLSGWITLGRLNNLWWLHQLLSSVITLQLIHFQYECKKCVLFFFFVCWRKCNSFIPILFEWFWPKLIQSWTSFPWVGFNQTNWFFLFCRVGKLLSLQYLSTTNEDNKV